MFFVNHASVENVARAPLWRFVSLIREREICAAAIQLISRPLLYVLYRIRGEEMVMS